jgi:hypothetical protein
MRTYSAVICMHPNESLLRIRESHKATKKNKQKSIIYRNFYKAMISLWILESGYRKNRQLKLIACLL